MQKTFALIVVLFCITVTTAGAYTVILKNGKSMTGTLVSETADIILFKDDSGIQYSLKKANLDLAKMTEVNAAPAPEPEAPPQEAPVAAETAKKKARVYTREDVDALRDKYPELSIGDPIENPEDFEGGTLKAEAYGTHLQEGATRVGDSVAGLVKLREAAATAWEIASSTGKDPSEAVTAALSTEEATTILKQTSDDLTSLGRWQESMAGAPDQYKEGYNMFVQAITDLSDFQRGLREWNTFENVNLFRSRLGEMENRLNGNVSRLKSWKPAGAPPAPPAPPAEETAEDQTPEAEPPLD